MIKFQQSQALTSHFESFWSIVAVKENKALECKKNNVSAHFSANQFLENFGLLGALLLLNFFQNSNFKCTMLQKFSKCEVKASLC